MGNEWKFNWGVFGVVFYFGLCAIFPPLILPLLFASAKFSSMVISDAVPFNGSWNTLAK